MRSVMLLAVGALCVGVCRLPAQQAAPAPLPAGVVPACKICVGEPKHTTRKVYACKREDYCLPCCSLLSLLRGKCGCGDGRCGDVRVRRLLVVKTCAGPDTNGCVLREAPAARPTLGAPLASCPAPRATDGKR